MFDCYRKEMAVNVEDIENILVAVLSGDEQEIYKALTKKKEIIDKSPNLRTVDEKNMLQSLSKKIRKFPKHLIDGIQKNHGNLFNNYEPPVLRTFPSTLVTVTWDDGHLDESDPWLLIRLNLLFQLNLQPVQFNCEFSQS